MSQYQRRYCYRAKRSLQDTSAFDNALHKHATLNYAAHFLRCMSISVKLLENHTEKLYFILK